MESQRQKSAEAKSRFFRSNFMQEASIQKKLDSLATKYWQTRSALIRMAIGEFIERRQEQRYAS